MDEIKRAQNAGKGLVGFYEPYVRDREAFRITPGFVEHASRDIDPHDITAAPGYRKRNTSDTATEIKGSRRVKFRLEILFDLPPDPCHIFLAAAEEIGPRLVV